MKPQTALYDPTSIKLRVFDPDDTDFQSKVNAIRESIKANGSLFHHPAIKDNGDLIFGLKRVLAAIQEGLDAIEVKVYPSDQPDSFYECLALDENLKRSNLAWYDQVLAERRLHQLRQTEIGPGKAGKKVGWSLRDTAKELDVALGSLSEDIRMAEAVMADPKLKLIADKMTARRVILSAVRRGVQEGEARATDPDKYNVVLQGNSAVVLTSFPNNTFDACITDPPWLEFKDDGLVKDEFTLDVFKEIYRTLKSPGFLYAFVSSTDWMIYQREFKAIGFSVQKWPLVWVKEGVLSHGQRTWEYQRDYEPILLAVKGAPALTSSMLSSVMSCKAVHSSQLIHPNQKPPEILKKLIDHCTFPGAVIVDPFGGSGETAVSAKAMDRQYVVIERDPGYCVNIKERLK